MGLSRILARVAAEIGIKTDNANEKAFLIDAVNTSARELYESRDLVGCDREVAMTLSRSTQQVSLPYYVGVVRALRNYTSKERIDLHDMRPRYKSDGWTENLLAWRKKGFSPTSTDYSNGGVLTLTIPVAESASFDVIIIGSTSTATRKQETVTFAAGDVSKTTVNGFESIDSIINPALHDCNVTVTDLDGTEIAVLPNSEYRTQYQLVQVIDYDAVNSMENPYVVEVLYKARFVPFRNDYDEFVVPGYDDAIIWQTVGDLTAKKDVDKAALAFQKVAKVLADRAREESQGVQKSIDFAPNPTLGIYDRMRKDVFPGTTWMR